MSGIKKSDLHPYLYEIEIDFKVINGYALKIKELYKILV